MILPAGSRQSRWLSPGRHVLPAGEGPTYPNELYSGQAIEVAETELHQGIDTRALIDEQGLVRARSVMDSGFQASRSVRLVNLGF